MIDLLDLNRAQKRQRTSKRNLVRQVINGKVIWHKKTENMPRQYQGIKAMTRSISERTRLAKLNEAA